MADHHDLPFKAEYAKSNRASCKLCRNNITKDSLRLAVMVQSPHFDGKQPNWFHSACFWKRARCTAFTDIHGFDSLRWEDQEKIKEKLGNGGGGASGDACEGDYNDYAAEYAKSNRSTCRGCGDKIDKDIVRLSRKDYESERAKMYGPQDMWYHIDCFAENRDEIEFTTEMQPDKIKGYKFLRKEDKEEIVKALGKGTKKRKGDKVDGKGAKKSKAEIKEDTEEEKALKAQNKLLWDIRDKLHKEISNDALKGLLEFNSQELPSGESKLLDRVSDCMAFGALSPCPECSGQLVYSQGGYHCTGNVTEWTKCQHLTKEPKRKAFKVPAEYHDVDFLKKYKYVKRERVFPKGIVSGVSGVVSSSGEALANKPLLGLKMGILGKTSRSKADITKALTDLGAKVVTKIDKSVAAVISTKAEVDKNSKGIANCKTNDVNVVDEDFLEKVKKGGAVLLIKQHRISSWGADPNKFLEDVVDGPSTSKSYGKSLAAKRDEAMFTKSVPKKMKMTVKGGAAVDPDSGMEDKGHIYQERGEPLNAILGLVDISRGTNSYYKLQVIEADSNNRWWVFRAWGRVGTTVGGNKLESCGSMVNAIAQFKSLYAEKTGNEWEKRKNFTKFPNKFYPLEIDYGEDDEVKLDDSAGTNSSLPKPTQDLIRMIFDVESMKKAMLEFEIDLKKMPLGKLSKKQIESAYKVLTELQGMIDGGGTSTQFLDASNRFYTLIPHDFGMRKPPLLDTAEVIKNKIEMLDNLLDIEVAYSMLKGGDAGTKDPIDVHYEKLKTKIEPMDKSSDEYKMLVEYVDNTHAATHTQYKLNVEEIYKVDREGEAKRFKPFRDLPNHMLLWHGSRTTNFAGILGQGLRIAPPEAPVTGYMFGKGVYFADMVTKSANYCRTSKSDPVGLLMLCDVALGNMHELTAASFVTSLPKGKHSTKGLGMTCPDPKDDYKTPDGVVIPKGKSTSAPIGRSSLLYNEYIVYDVAQIHCKYLLKTKFNFKW